MLNVSGIRIPFIYETKRFCTAKKRKKCLIFHRKLTPLFGHLMPDFTDEDEFPVVLIGLEDRSLVIWYGRRLDDRQFVTLTYRSLESRIVTV